MTAANWRARFNPIPPTHHHHHTHTHNTLPYPPRPRTQLYHLGALARLADADALRHVEVISCVSGGAIVGAHLYLLLRNLLESKKDAEITCEVSGESTHHRRRAPERVVGARSARY